MMRDPQEISVIPVALTQSGEPKIRLISPYHPDVPKRARALGGVWSAKHQQWWFDPRDEERVRSLAREIFGTDGRNPVDLCNIRVEFDTLFGFTGGLYIAGREVARNLSAVGTDRVHELAPGVAIITEPVYASDDVLRFAPGTIIEVRDLPREAVERELKKRRQGMIITIAGDVPVHDAMLAQMGAGMAQSEIETLWASIRELDEADRVELRNRLLQEL